MLSTARAFAWGALLASAIPAVAQTQSVDSATPPPLDAAVAGPAPIHASPVESVNDTAERRPARTGRTLGRLLGNGTPMNYGSAGANALGDTGGLTTGAKGGAGVLAGSGGVRAGAEAALPRRVEAPVEATEARPPLEAPAPAGGR